MNLDHFSILFERGDTGLWFAYSCDYKGFFIAERTLPELFREIPLAMGALEKARAEMSVSEPGEPAIEPAKNRG